MIPHELPRVFDLVDRRIVRSPFDSLPDRIGSLAKTRKAGTPKS
jgi:hypothetical protein